MQIELTLDDFLPVSWLPTTVLHQLKMSQRQLKSKTQTQTKTDSTDQKSE
jgi:hypothetical protein